MEINNKIIDDWIKEDLAKSGLDMNTFPIIPLKSEKQLKEILSFSTIGNQSIFVIGGYFIPYPLQEEYYRLKLRYPIGDAKYLSPKGTPNYPYITKEVYDNVQEYNPDTPIILTEGEKKAAKAIKEGFMAIGLAGVWCFKNKDNDFLPQLENLSLYYRKCFIAFDSDIIGKHSVRHAELRLAVNLINRGATPISARFPLQENGEKIGLDDYLVLYGKYELQKLMHDAIGTFEVHLREGTSIKLILEEAGLIESEFEREKIIKMISNHTKIPIKTIRKSVHPKVKPEEKDETNSEEFTEEEKKEAKKILKDPKILERMLQTVESSGYVGEEINKTMLFLSFISRMSDNSISCIIKGASASGKSTLVQSVLQLFPKEDQLMFSMITPKALVHSKVDFSHKILFIQERHGSEQSDYSIRTVISEGEISISIPIKNEATNDFETIEKRVFAKGMVYVETTTKDQVHDENQTRVFDLYMDESEKQTELILLAEAQGIDKNSIEKEARIWRCAMQLLSPYEVYIPYAKELAKIFPKNKLRVRRDFKRFLALIKAHALLYQHQRKIQGNQMIATKEDLMAVLPLADKVLIQSLKDISPGQETVLKIIQDEFPECEFSSHQLSEKVKDISYTTVKNYLRRFESLGLVEWNGKKGAESRYCLSDSIVSLSDTFFSLSEGLSDKDFQSDKPDLSDVVPLSSDASIDEENGNGLDHKTERDIFDLSHQMASKTNDNNGFSETSCLLDIKTGDIRSDKRGNDSDTKAEPFITPEGDLSIPFDSDPKYHYWKNGRSVESIREEISSKQNNTKERGDDQ